MVIVENYWDNIELEPLVQRAIRSVEIDSQIPETIINNYGFRNTLKLGTLRSSLLLGAYISAGVNIVEALKLTINNENKIINDGVYKLNQKVVVEYNSKVIFGTIASAQGKGEYRDVILDDHEGVFKIDNKHISSLRYNWQYVPGEQVFIRDNYFIRVGYIVERDMINGKYRILWYGGDGALITKDINQILEPYIQISKGSIERTPIEAGNMVKEFGLPAFRADKLSKIYEDWAYSPYGSRVDYEKDFDEIISELKNGIFSAWNLKLKTFNQIYDYYSALSQQYNPKSLILETGYLVYMDDELDNILLLADYVTGRNAQQIVEKGVAKPMLAIDYKKLNIVEKRVEPIFLIGDEINFAISSKDLYQKDVIYPSIISDKANLFRGVIIDVTIGTYNRYKIKGLDNKIYDRYWFFVFAIGDNYQNLKVYDLFNEINNKWYTDYEVFQKDFSDEYNSRPGDYFKEDKIKIIKVSQLKTESTDKKKFIDYRNFNNNNNKIYFFSSNINKNFIKISTGFWYYTHKTIKDLSILIDFGKNITYIFLPHQVMIRVKRRLKKKLRRLMDSEITDINPFTTYATTSTDYTDNTVSEIQQAISEELNIAYEGFHELSGEIIRDFDAELHGYLPEIPQINTGLFDIDVPAPLPDIEDLFDIDEIVDLNNIGPAIVDRARELLDMGNPEFLINAVLAENPRDLEEFELALHNAQGFQIQDPEPQLWVSWFAWIFRGGINFIKRGRREYPITTGIVLIGGVSVTIYGLYRWFNVVDVVVTATTTVVADTYEGGKNVAVALLEVAKAVPLAVLKFGGDLPAAIQKTSANFALIAGVVGIVIIYNMFNKTTLFSPI